MGLATILTNGPRKAFAADKAKKTNDELRVEQAVETAGRGAVLEVIEATIKDKLGESSFGAKTDEPNSTHIVSAANYGSEIRFDIVVVTKRSNRIETTNTLQAFMGQLGFPEQAHECRNPEKPVPKFFLATPSWIGWDTALAQNEYGHVPLTVNTQLLLDNLGIKEKAALAQRDAKISKADELGIKTPN